MSSERSIDSVSLGPSCSGHMVPMHSEYDIWLCSRNMYSPNAPWPKEIAAGYWNKCNERVVCVSACVLNSFGYSENSTHRDSGFCPKLNIGVNTQGKYLHADYGCFRGSLPKSISLNTLLVICFGGRHPSGCWTACLFLLSTTSYWGLTKHFFYYLSFCILHTPLFSSLLLNTLLNTLAHCIVFAYSENIAQNTPYKVDTYLVYLPLWQLKLHYW